jgi:PAS domain S-box-containing protein
MRHRDGRRVWCDIAFSTVTDPDSGRESRVGTIRDVTAEHAAAEQLRGRAAADRTARDAAEGVSAQLRALVEGLAAVVWEADARTWRISFISERVEEILGYPVRDWMADEGFWPSLIDPRDRESVLHRLGQAVAAGKDFELVYRVTAADGRTVWLQDLVHVLTGADGAPERLQGVMIDVTQRERTRQASALLAEVGRLQAEPGSLVDGLAALLHAAVPALADLGVVSLLGPDGMLAPVAAARPDRPEVAQAVLDMPAYPLSPHLEDAYAARRPFVVQTPTDAELRALSAGETDYEGRRKLGIRTALVVPLEAAGRLLGTLSFVSTERVREHDAADLALAGELGQRAAVAVERARLATRERHLVELTAALAAAGTMAEAARALVGGIIEVLDATAGAAYLADPGHGMRIVHSSGYPEVILAHYSTVRLDAVGPVADCARERRAVWLRDDDDWALHYPGLLGHHAETGNVALMVVPLIAGDRVVGAMAASFGTRRMFDADERRFAETIAVQAAQAFERAALADVRREIAETLQHSLLPPAPPTVAGIALATRYLPGAHGTQAGGDWYDVLPLADNTDENAARVAVVVGDVVGQGATAAAVMGQLRSVLAAALLDGLGPADALAHLDRFARRLEGARASTVACTVLDTGTGELCWARAGHPPPLVLDAAGPRYLHGGAGSVLGAPGTPEFLEERTVLAPGSTLVLYTDGLVERRGEPIDEGLARLARAAAAVGAAVPEQMVTEILHRTLHPAGPPDDVALIVARLLPAPLRCRLPARPDQLRLLRRQIAAWANAAALPREVTQDLQLAVGEAAANAIEHAYTADGSGGEFVVELSSETGRQVAVQVRDFGRWRPAPADKGFRGRGVDLIRLLSTDLVVDPGPDGTTVEFRLSARRDTTPAAPGPSDPAEPVEPARPASLRAWTDDGGRRIELAGDLDLAGVAAVREPLLAALAAARGSVRLDLTALDYLASAGIGLLAEALDGAPGPVEVLSPAAGPVRAALDLVRLVPVHDNAVEPPIS